MLEESSLRVVPCSLRKANDFVEVYHRHNIRTARNGGKFAIAAAIGSEVVGVAIVGNPLSATYMDGFTAEILRVCTAPSAPKNCNSLIYGACRRVWFGMGGSRIVTYTLTTESGISLRASGWRMTATIKGHDPKTWGKKTIQDRREQEIIAREKFRWESFNSASTPLSKLNWPKKVEEAGERWEKETESRREGRRERMEAKKNS